MSKARWFAVAVLVAAAVFAVTGGQFPLVEYRRLALRERIMTARVDSLAHDVDSLRAFRDSLRDMPEVQERVARARSGMIRPGEIAILLVPEATDGDSGGVP
ncbi:MAG: septum formation initiator family protein [Gemmatimonadota bacterium]